MHPDQRAGSPADMFQPIVLTVVHQMVASKLGGNDLANNGQHGMLQNVSCAICCLVRVHCGKNAPSKCTHVLKEAVYMQQALHSDFVTLPWHSSWTMLAGRHVRLTQ